MKNIAMNVHNWMERNLQEPFFIAEMRRAEPSDRGDKAKNSLKISAAAGMVLLVCWLAVTIAG